MMKLIHVQTFRRTPASQPHYGLQDVILCHEIQDKNLDRITIKQKSKNMKIQVVQKKWLCIKYIFMFNCR